MPSSSDSPNSPIPIPTAVVCGILALTTAYPLLRLLLGGFFVPGEGFTLGPLMEVAKNSSTWMVLKNTFVVSLAATAISIAIGTSGALLVVKSDIPFKGAITAATLLFLLLPPYVQALGWLQLWGPVGWFNRLASLMAGKRMVVWNAYGLDGTIALLGILHYPVVYLSTMAALRNIPPEVEEVAATFGFKRWRILSRITIPLAAPGIAAGGVLAFVGSLGNFGVPALVALPSGSVVLSTYIFQQVVGFTEVSFAKVTILASLGAIVAVGGLYFQHRLIRKALYRTPSPAKEPYRFAIGRTRILLSAAVLLFLGCAALGPIMALVLTSLLPAYGVKLSLSTATLKNYAFVLFGLNETWRATFNSLVLAVGAAAATITLGFVVARGVARRKGIFLWIDRVGSIPYAIPGTIFALAMILSWVDPWFPLHIYGTRWVMLLAYVARFFTIATRTLAAGFLQLDPSYEEAAQVVGLKPLRKLVRITLPLLRSHWQAALLLVFVTALTELTVSGLLWTSGNETIGVTVYNLEAAGYTTYSTAFSVLVTLLFGFALFLLRRYGTSLFGR